MPSATWPRAVLTRSMAPGPLKRLIKKEVINTLSRKIISGELDKSKPVLIDVFNGVVVVRNEGESHPTIQFLETHNACKPQS